ncbi:MAG: hypothetical protein II699_05660 [Lachnospiraceae bacterium]|jgi:hypothetical protein|nr:hypothetical protein [Lachnospiraceae bacterium]
MDEHMKKMIAPITITVILIIYYILYFAFIMFLVKGLILKLLIGIIPIVFGVAMIYVCIERIKEIQGGEEDDLSKY